MDRERIEEMMADYLGRELDRKQEERFLSLLENHPDVAREVEELEESLARLHAPRIPIKRRRFLLPLAAAVVLSFMAGFATHGLVSAEPAVEESLEGAMTEAYMESSADSRWARSLVAFSRACKNR